MPRYKDCSRDQDMMIPISFKKQLQPGTFEWTLDHIIEHHVEVAPFEKKLKNDQTGAPAWNPKVMLKIILFGYSRGLVSSRDIEAACRENIIFMALSAYSQPHFTTISDFISGMKEEVRAVFISVLTLCDELGLIGGELFAIDGCKFSSNASKEWSGTKEELKKKKEKMEKTVDFLLKRHTASDENENASFLKQSHETQKNQVEHLKKKIKKIDDWLKDNDDKPGSSGKVRKSNITDNESAKMKSSRGYIQGYNGVSTADEKYQIILHAEAYGEGDHHVLQDSVQRLKENLNEIGKEELLKKVKFTADSGFHTKDNVEWMEQNGIDAYLPDKNFRKRDPRFADADKYKKDCEKNHENKPRRFYGPKSFHWDPVRQKMICPAGNEMYIKNSHFKMQEQKYFGFIGKKTDCRVCPLRDRCQRNETSEQRQVYFLIENLDQKNSLTEKMKNKIDSIFGKWVYSKRMKVIEPVFANIRHNLGLNRFTLRSKAKVNIQWNLFNIVHNIGKILSFGSIPVWNTV